MDIFAFQKMLELTYYNQFKMNNILLFFFFGCIYEQI